MLTQQLSCRVHTVLLTGGFEFQIWFGIGLLTVCTDPEACLHDVTDVLHVGLPFERNGLDRRHFVYGEPIEVVCIFLSSNDDLQIWI